MSVTFAPRARIAVKASCPGVSRKVIPRPSWSTWYAPMCWVIPPASVSTTEVFRIASSSVVLPWSTCPMIVTTGGRGGGEVGLAVLEGLRLFVVVCSVLDRDLALGRELCGHELDFLVRERLRDRDGLPEAHHEHDDLRGRNPESLRQISDADTGLDRHWPGDRSYLARRLRARCFALALLLSSVAGTRRRVVDDHASLPALARATLAGPHGPIWSV